jgi:starch synthase (maltosyl-transferring)
MRDIRKRVLIENLRPVVDSGRFPIRRSAGEQVKVMADIFADGHDHLAAEMLFRRQGESRWQSRPMQMGFNDEWQAVFKVPEVGRYEYTVQAWIDRFRTWLAAVGKKHDAGQALRLEMIEGARLVEAAAMRARESDRQWLLEKASLLSSMESDSEKIDLVGAPDFLRVMDAYADRSAMTSIPQILSVAVEPPRARYSTWYELFPRSAADDPQRHGTFEDCMQRLPAIADMGFDVLYLPPIHPIGRTNRKGKNNAPQAGPDDPGSPWAIGAPEGGHRAIHPQLGDIESFRGLVAAARSHGIEIAMDLAFQCSPDHPYVREHPEWFRKRPDDSIQYAENPPKKYEDIYPFDFESEHAEALWQELLEVVRYWIEQGVHIFRVDNPHTKPLRFWEWLIAQIKQTQPQILFLAEAFTRPKSMYRLAKGGFTQSYTYFTWRNLKWEIEAYMTELTQSVAAEFFWPNFWPNTPDILPEFLQLGDRPAFVIRLALAATLSSNYGIYGPAFELCENEAKEQSSEEYLNSEKYQIRHWDLNQPGNLRGLIKRINRIRRENPALQQTRNLRFLTVDREEIIAYCKYTDDHDNIVLTAVNLDPRHTHAVWLHLPLELMGAATDQPFQVHDLVSDARYLWHSGSNYVELNPQVMPVHIFRIRKRLRSEHDFDYFM